MAMHQCDNSDRLASHLAWPACAWVRVRILVHLCDAAHEAAVASQIRI